MAYSNVRSYELTGGLHDLTGRLASVDQAVWLTHFGIYTPVTAFSMCWMLVLVYIDNAQTPTNMPKTHVCLVSLC